MVARGMSKLTEDMVVARSRLSDISAVKKLNCWGAELEDVSLLRHMPNVEVLAFSLNKIRSLAEFAHCPRLAELYLRKNCITDLSEIRHLARLPRLVSLWLEENPCTDRPDYRWCVLRTLPNLRKLDNVPVSEDELARALQPSEPSPAPSPPASPASPASSPHSEPYTQDCQEEEWRGSSPDLEASAQAPGAQPPGAGPGPACPADYAGNGYMRSPPAHTQAQYSPPPQRRAPPHHYHHGGGWEEPPPRPPARHSADLTPPHRHHFHPDDRCETWSRCGGECGAERGGRAPRPPVTRNSNLLSALLCLVKELDYNSLEVAEMAVRCRMDELLASRPPACQQ